MDVEDNNQPADNDPLDSWDSICDIFEFNRALCDKIPFGSPRQWLTSLDAVAHPLVEMAYYGITKEEAKSLATFHLNLQSWESSK